jgi:hypothetical protein
MDMNPEWAMGLDQAYVGREQGEGYPYLVYMPQYFRQKSSQF